MSSSSSSTSNSIDPKTVSYSLKHCITENESDVFCIRYSPDDQLLLVGCGDGYLRVFNSSTGRLMYTWNTAGQSLIKLPATAVRFKPDDPNSKSKNIAIVAGSGGVIQHWHVTSGRLLNTITEEGNQVYALDYRKDGKVFATSGKDSHVRVYDEGTRSLLMTMSGGDGKSTAGHANRVFAVKYHPYDDNLILTGGWDNTVQIWDKRTDYAVRRIYGPHICGDALDMNDRGEVLTGSWRPSHQLQIWDFKSGKLLEDVKYPVDIAANSKCNLYTAQFSDPNGTLIAAGGSGANEAKIMNREGKKVGGISGLDRSVYCLSFSHDSRSIAIAGGDGKIYVLKTK